MKYLLLALFLCSVVFGQDITKTVITGTKVTFNVTADGTPPIAFKWFKDGGQISEGPQLVIDSATPTHNGVYTVTAVNQFGTSESNKATLLVGTPPSAPVITVALPPAMAARNQTRHFPLRISATGASRYVWSWNGIPLPGQTADTYTIPKVNPSFAGRYDVDAFASNGQSARSSTVLTVLK